MTKLTTRKIQCAQCSKTFTALRAEATYCSLNCRVAAHRARAAAPVTATVTAPHTAPVTAARNAKPTPNKPNDEAVIQARIDAAVEAERDKVFAGIRALDAEVTRPTRGTDTQKLDRFIKKLPEPVVRALGYAIDTWCQRRYDALVRESFPQEHAKLAEARAEAAAKIKQAEARLERLDHWMTHDEYRKVLSCLHSDKQPDQSKRRFDEAFEIFKRLEVQAGWKK